MLLIDNISARFGSRKVLSNINLRINQGEILGLLGPNGAGKTTLVRLIMGLLKPDSGQITLFDHCSPGELDAKRQIGYMPQQLAIYNGLTVLENLLFYARIFGVEEKQVKSRVDEIIHMVELVDKRHDSVSTLSGGMIRRIMLATTLIHKPSLLILDEPTVGVDPLLRLKFWHWFRGMAASGISIIITTHNINEASNCQRVVFLREGSILEQGSPDEIKKTYQTESLEEAFISITRTREKQKSNEDH